ncbi:hypothetical protein RCL_jg9743.t1 [Rhizophagus clarus]|uniref:Uncharacterized protein n=1 Tax=Rhizophagus clarus TaxID=94130 RepID=A0A8H3QXU4_9GLOM|nr:hypothetical protein RCL_jg9743.t1 [Rhizophagus clarus]
MRGSGSIQLLIVELSTSLVYENLSISKRIKYWFITSVVKKNVTITTKSQVNSFLVILAFLLRAIYRIFGSKTR